MTIRMCVFILAGLSAGYAGFAEAPYPDALERAAITLSTLDSPINDALLIGNGDLNALVFAEGDDLVIRITKNDVWDARLESALDPPIPTLDRLLELGNGAWENREYILPEGSTWKGPDSYHAHPYPCPRACGVLRVEGAATPPLVAKLDLRRARVDVYSASGKHTIHIPIDTNAVIVERTDGIVSCKLEPIASNELPPLESGESKQATWILQQIPGDLDWPGMSFSVALSQYEGRAAAAVVTSLESETPQEPATKLAGFSILPEVEDPFRIPGGSGSQASIPVQIAGHHEAAWEAFWQRSGIQLSDEVLERVWYRNLYFLRCVTKPGVISTGLFAGLLDDKPAWHGDYHTNYNIQQTYWSAYAANQCELTEPYDRLITEYLPRARWMARTIFDMNGAYIPHVLFAYEPPDPAACKSPGGRQYIHHVWGFTQGVNGFSVQPLWWHYKYYPDTGFLRDVAYPAVRDVADFQAEFVARCERRGDRVELAPTVSPEHWGWTQGFEKNRNCTFDIAMFRYIFEAAIEGATTLGIDADKAEQWRAAEALLPDYPVWNEGPNVVVDVEGAPPIEYNIPVPTTPVFPGDVVTAASPEPERALFTNTLQHLKHNGNNAPIMLAVARARLATPDARDWLHTELAWRERRNGTLSFNRLDPRYRFNDFGHYTEMFGAALPVMELLLQSVGDVVRLFPAWPSHLPASFSSLRAQGGFLVSADFADGAVGNLRIECTAEGESTLRIVMPWEHSEVWRSTDGEWTPVTVENGIAEIATRLGESLQFRKKPE